MALADIQLKGVAETAVAVRGDAVAFANAALAMRRRTGVAMRDHGPEERERARRIFAAVAEYYRLRTRGGMTRHQAALAVKTRLDLAKPLLDMGLKVGERTLDDWMAKVGGSPMELREPDGERMWELCRDYAAGAAKRLEENLPDPQFMGAFMENYLNGNAMLVAPAYRAAFERCVRDGMAPDEIPALHQVRHWMRTRVNARALAKGRMTDEQYQNGLGGYAMRDWNCEVGDCWVGDHRILDVWVRMETAEGKWVAQRPWATAWMDVKSGFFPAVLIYADAYPNHAKILEALYLGILGTGGRPPRRLLTDNGKDYLKHGALQDARMQPPTEPTRGANRHRTLVEETFAPVLGEHRHSVARELGIEIDLAAPYKGRQKPIERRFRDFAQEFDRMWPGYTGNSPATRPQYGEVYRGNPATLPTEGQLRDAFRQWLGAYHGRANGSRVTGGAPPAELWERRMESTPAMTGEQLEWAMLIPHGRALQVRRGPSGCDVWYHGWPYTGASPADCLALRQHWEKDVMVKTSWAPDPKHMFAFGQRELPLRLWIFDLDGKLICEGRAEPTIEVFGRKEGKAARIQAAMRRSATIARADREERNLLRGRATQAFPARRLYPHGAGEALPEIEGGAPVHAPMLPGPGKGRARLPRARMGGDVGTAAAPSDAEWDRLLAGAGQGPDDVGEMARILRAEREKKEI